LRHEKAWSPKAHITAATHKEACRSCDGTGYAESQHADGHASTGTCWRCGGLGFIETIDRKEAHERSNRL
jgi:DnaJ-class molecular chaperone